jgi:pyruvate,water dikinase
MSYVRAFRDLGIADVGLVGGKNASLGEMLRPLGAAGVQVPDGFAVTADAYRYFLRENRLDDAIRDLLAGLDVRNVQELSERSRRIRNLMLAARLPVDLQQEITAAYRRCGEAWNLADPYVAVRSSATAEDLPTASFAGQQESYLHVHGNGELLDAVVRCFASLFTGRAISYRADMGFDQLAVALSVGVQRMVRADLGSAGVAFTLDPESGFRDVILVSSNHGIGETIVQGRVTPDEFYVHKPTLRAGFRSLVWKKCGSKQLKMVYDETSQRLRSVPTSEAERRQLSLGDADVLQLARWALAIEEHYSRIHGQPTAMDIEWARDGDTGELFIVQARPETVHSRQRGPSLRRYELRGSGPVAVEGLAVGEAIASGPARVVTDPRQMERVRPGDVLITDSTDPDWEPVMKIAGAIVTERGGRTSHAAIVAREMGIPAVVGASGAMQQIAEDERVTVSCAEGAVGRVYRGELPFDVREFDAGALPPLSTRIMMNLAQPEKAFHLAQLPCDGVGLARMEFIFAGWIGVHPLALLGGEILPIEVQRRIDELAHGYADPREYFIDRLSQGIGVLAAAFWPRPVILRFSDFKTNEYAHLIGGEQFEPREENPMLGWRGASRYYHPAYRDGFALEVAAILRVRKQFGLTNLHVMVPFCRTPAEGKSVLATAAAAGLHRGDDGLRVYVMAEIPSNVLLADQFAALFDGFSIGSNDLTQLVLGVDRDSERVAPLFDERDEAVKRACVMLIEAAHRHGVPVSICGQAPSDHPEFASFLVAHGIDSLSLAPDALLSVRQRLAAEEQRGPARQVKPV